jgi:hypothetical protein
VADQQSNETIRQMMAGFSAMQQNLGLLPMPMAQSMAGAPAPFQVAPPPPPIRHPAEAAADAMAAQQAMMQQTLHAAQATRYMPPPSAPMPALSAMAAYSPMPGPRGFGGGVPGFGGGFGSAAASMPSIFNPMAPTMPGAHFMSPAMQGLQFHGHHQAQMMGAIAGVGEGALGIGGSMLGGAIGSMFGPLGTMAGSWLGNKVGGVVANTIFNPVTQDFARGRQIQQMTAPFMVTGANLNSATGQGFSAQGARDIASGIRHLNRDHDFERTGFNTQDAMRIMSMSAEQGLLTGTQAPDQIVQKVKEISKTVKMLMRITGDPDVRDAIRSLGQMRDLGFQGLAAQAGAVANRATFARMAGQSQAQMTATMMAGGDLAAQYGLVGATGANAAMFGAGSANVAASSGAVGEIGLARVGGVSGLGQLNARGGLAAMQNEQYLLAAMGRDSKGHMTVDMDRYRATQNMSFQEVQRAAADSLLNMGKTGIFEWNTHKQELKDQIAQQLRPGEMQQMMLAQARQLQAAVPTMNLGSALQQTAGISAEEAGVLEHQFGSRRYWQGMMQQNRVRRRELMEEERAHRESFRTPGLMTRMGRGIRDKLGAAGDAISSPFRSLSERLDRVGEDEAAADAGERISRYDDVDIAHDAAERAMLKRGLQRGFLLKGGGTSLSNDLGRGVGAINRRSINRIGSFLGLASESDDNRIAAIADYSQGRFTSFGETFGDAQDARRRVQDVTGVGRAAGAAPQTADQLDTMYQRISDASKTPGKKFNAGAILGATTQNVVRKLQGMKAGLIKSASAFAESDFKESWMQEATNQGMTRQEAGAAWRQTKNQVMASVIEDVKASGNKELAEPLVKAQEVAARAGAVDIGQSTDEAEKAVKSKLDESWMFDMNDKTAQEVKAVLGGHDKDVVALAATIRANTSGTYQEQRGAAVVDADMQKRLGKDYGKKMREAKTLAQSLSKDAAGALMSTLQPTAAYKEGGAGGVLTRLGKAEEGLTGKMQIAAEKEFLQNLASKTGRKDLTGMSVEEAAKSISEGDELDALDPKTKAAIMEFKKTGNTAKLQDVVGAAGPTNRTMRHSDAASSVFDQLDKDYAKLSDEADRAEDDTGQAATDPSQKMFSDSVRLFADAVKIMAGHGDDAKLDAAAVWKQALKGGG